MAKKNYNTYLLDKAGIPTKDLSRGDLYVSVSTILKVEGKDLIKWALKTFGESPKPLEAYDQYMNEVSSLGTRIHNYVELDLKGQTPADSSVTEDMIPAIESYFNFKNSHKIKLIDSERVVSSFKWRCAGQCDLVLELDDQLFVADWKTGGVYPSAFTQMAAYKAFMMQEPPKRKIKGIEKADLLVINLHRNGKPVELHTLESYYKGKISINDELGVFHSLRYVWFNRNIKSRNFEAVIKNMDEIMSPLEASFKKTFEL